MTFAAYLAPGYEKLLAIAAVAALTAVNYRGITRTAALTKILVTLVLLALAVFFGAVLLGVAPDPAAIAASAGSGAGASAAPTSPAATIYGVMQGAGLLFFSNRYISLAVNTYLIFWNMISKSALPKEVR